MVDVPAEIKNTQSNKKIKVLFLKTSFTFLKDCVSIAAGFSLSGFNEKAKIKVNNILIADTVKITVMSMASISCPVIMPVNAQPAAPAIRPATMR